MKKTAFYLRHSAKQSLALMESLKFVLMSFITIARITDDDSAESMKDDDPPNGALDPPNSSLNLWRVS